ncbi:MAG: formylglycine-generating enzyme family protein [Planctomycetota bacterium]|nr:formylglycine-generating enzyme family protein [Planctomycetota bacterium]
MEIARQHVEITLATLYDNGIGQAAGERVLLKVKEIDLPMRWCPPGEFLMGTPSYEEGRDEDQVSVTLSGFWIPETECTQQLWSAVMGSSPEAERGKGAVFPVYNVSHEECETFCKKLQALLTSSNSVPAGWTLQLPSEAQWEYACRAGSTTRFHFGDQDSQLDEYAWYDKNSSGSTHPVGTKKPNAWGIHDMSGNVREWCADWYGAKLPGGSDPVGPSSASDRVRRGGCWSFTPAYCRSAFRHRYVPSVRYFNLGFRPALSLVGAE